MSAVIRRLRPGGVSVTPPELDRFLAPVLARLAAIEAQVEELTRERLVSHVRLMPSDTYKLDQLRGACLELGIPVSGDGYVLESAAARLVNRSPTTLRNWRYAERPLPFRRLGGRIEYALSELAVFLEARGED